MGKGGMVANERYMSIITDIPIPPPKDAQKWFILPCEVVPLSTDSGVTLKATQTISPVGAVVCGLCRSDDCVVYVLTSQPVPAPHAT